MARLPVIKFENAGKEIQNIYNAIKVKFGMVPNIFKGMASSPGYGSGSAAGT